MTKRSLITSLIVVALAAIIILPKVLRKDPNANEATNKGVQGPILVGVTVVKPQKLDNAISVAGTLLPNEEVELKSEINGRVTHIYFKEGAAVSKGQILLKLYDADLQAQRAKLELQEKLAAEKEYRQKKLLEKEAISKEEYDIILSTLNTTKADLALVKTQIDKTEIRAPFNGVIGLKYISEGSYITPTQHIASMQNISQLKLDFSIPEKYSNLVSVGSLVNFKTQNSHKSYQAKVYAIEPKIDLTTRSLQLRAICDNNNKNLYAGSFAEVNLRIKENTEALVVPTEAVVPELKGQKVYLVKDGKAFPQKVQTGLRTDKYIEITDGIKAGDSVITTGVIKVKPKATVKVLN